jgi:O-antigen ligase
MARADAWRLVAPSFALAALFVPMLALVNAQSVAPIFAVMAVAVAAGVLARWREMAWPRATLAVTAAGLAWAAASILWAVEPRAALRLWPSLALTAAAGIAMLAAARRLDVGAVARLERASIIGVTIALAVLSLEAIARYASLPVTPQQLVLRAFDRGFELSALNRTVSVLAIQVWVAAAALARRRGPVAASALILWIAALAPAFASLAAIVALAAGALGAALALLATRLRAPIAVTIGLACFTMPALTSWSVFTAYFGDDARDGSLWHRVAIWRFVDERIADRPFLGWGLNASRFLGEKAELRPSIEVLPLHPHNGALQLWVELGVVGASCGAVLAALAAWRALDPALDAPARAAAMATLASCLVIALTAYGLWQGWWFCLLWLAAAWVVATARPRRT